MRRPSVVYMRTRGRPTPGGWPSAIGGRMRCKTSRTAVSFTYGYGLPSTVPVSISKLVMSSPSVRRLRNSASVKPARISERSSTPTTKNSSPAKFQMKMMRAMRERRIARKSPSGFVVPVADAIEGFDRVERVVDVAEFLAEPLDVAVDGSVVDIDLIIIGRVHQLVAALHVTRALGQRLEDEEFRHREAHLFALPGAGVTVGIEREFASHDRFLVASLPAGRAGARAPQKRLHAFAEQALGERLFDVVVGADIEADDLVHLIVLRGEEDDRQIGALAQAAQHF